MGVAAESSGYFFNSSSGDRTYNAESFEEWLKPFFATGVFTGGLAVTAAGGNMTVNVSGGYANLDGKVGKWSGSNAFSLATASGSYDRIDTIVVRRDNSNRTITIEVVTGSASFEPVPTAPTRNSSIYELVLAEILVPRGATAITQAAITDKRPDTSVCGYVVSAVQTPDFTELFDQFTAQADEFIAAEETDFLTWYQSMKDQLDEDAAGHLQLEIDATNAAVSDVMESIAIICNGNQCAATVAAGQYVYLKDSTISGLTDGLYKASQAIPASTVIDSTYLTAVPGGIANALGSVETFENTVNGLTARGYKYGRIVYVQFSRSASLTITEWTRYKAASIIPEGFRPPYETIAPVSTRGYETFQVTQERNGSGHWSGPVLVVNVNGDVTVGARGTMSCEQILSSVTYICAE